MNYFLQIWHNRSLRRKILFTIFALLLFRLVAHITVPGVDPEALKSVFEQNALLGVFSALTGGSMENFSIVLMGLAPYINASIILQLMTVIVPRLEALNKEGEQGRKVINRYTRYLTFPLAFMQSYGMIVLLDSSARASGGALLESTALLTVLPLMLYISTGTLFLMWLGEIMTEKGIGNGISMLIAASIISAMPAIAGRIMGISQVGATDQLRDFIMFAILSIGLLVVVVLITEGQRKIPIQYATRATTQGRSDLPIRVNQAGMIPIIFAVALLSFPAVLAQFFKSAESPWLADFSTWLIGALNGSNPGWIYIIIYFLLVLGFSYFYVSVTFNAEQVAENIQKRGGFVPGIRPGSQTAEYLQKTSSHMNLWGGSFLGAIAIIPLIFTKYTSLTPGDLLISGAGMIIVVGVVLELSRQIKAQVQTQSYDKLM